MTHRWIDHTAELELRVETDSEETVFGEALEAIRELLGEPKAEASPVAELIEVQGPDRPALLAAWLEEIAFLAERRGLIAERVTELDLHQTSLRASVEARLGEIEDAKTLAGLLLYLRSRS